MQKEVFPPSSTEHPQQISPSETGIIPEHEIPAGRLSLAGLRRTWSAVRHWGRRNVHAPSDPRLHVSDVALYPDAMPQALEPVRDTLNDDPEIEDVVVATAVSYFKELVEPQALLTERKHLSIDYENRTSPRIEQELQKTQQKLAEAEQQRNMDRAQVERHALHALEDFVGQKYAIAHRLNYMRHFRGGLMLTPSDERAVTMLGHLQRSASPEAQQFIPRSRLDEHVPDPGQRILIERTKDDEPFELPVRNFVAAEGMQSWERGRGTTLKVTEDNGALTSAEVIKEYASRATLAPPIERVRGYIQPNGMITLVTDGGSHRTAAAILRGDKTIKANVLELYSVDQDFLVPPADPVAPEHTADGDYELPQPSLLQ